MYTSHENCEEFFSNSKKIKNQNERRDFCHLAPKVHYALSDTSQSNQTSNPFFNIGNIIQKCKRDATQVHGKYTREHPKGEKNIIKKIQNCHLKLVSSIKANESDDVDGLAVSFFVQFKSYRWQNQDNIQAKTKVSSKKK